MARKMMCAICNDAIPEDDTTVLRVMVKPPAKGVPYRVLEDSWNKSFSVRTIRRIKLAR